MKKARTYSLIAAALVAGLVIGNMASAVAARQNAGDAAQGAGREARADAPCGGPFGMRMGARDSGARPVDVLAELTGLSREEIAAKCSAGESISDIASSADIEPGDVIDAILESRSEMLAARVADGSMTREQADAVLERMRERLTERIEASGPGRGCGGPSACATGGFGQGAGGQGRGMGPGGGGKSARGCGGACAGSCSTAP